MSKLIVFSRWQHACFWKMLLLYSFVLLQQTMIIICIATTNKLTEFWEKFINITCTVPWLIRTCKMPWAKPTPVTKALWTYQIQRYVSGKPPVYHYLISDRNSSSCIHLCLNCRFSIQHIRDCTKVQFAINLNGEVSWIMYPYETPAKSETIRSISNAIEPIRTWLFKRCYYTSFYAPKYDQRLENVSIVWYNDIL